MGPVGRISRDGFDPARYLRSWNFSDLPAEERAKFYRETPRPDGSLLREYSFFAVDREIEIAPGLFFPAWTYNGQVPGPTIRATEGDRVRVSFLNQGSHPHSIHFHGWHPPAMDGSLPSQQVMPGGTFVYEFDAEPFGLHLYHCHTVPLKRHIHKGLYGTFIVDPRGGGDGAPGRPPADEFVMMMNGFDTNFDVENEVYAVNTVANFYMNEPIRVEVGRLVRIYLINVTEFDLVNSFHLHGMFFDVMRTGTRFEPRELTDTVMLCQGERAILETTFRYPGDFMFHAHQSEFAELGWMGLFRAEARNVT
jgi:FtsP/CotA-like multicopper oxidase with cupredoxin domain